MFTWSVVDPGERFVCYGNGAALRSPRRYAVWPELHQRFLWSDRRHQCQQCRSNDDRQRPSGSANANGLGYSALNGRFIFQPDRVRYTEFISYIPSTGTKVTLTARLLRRS